jgi:hypothetical protein
VNSNNLQANSNNQTPHKNIESISESPIRDQFETDEKEEPSQQVESNEDNEKVEYQNLETKDEGENQTLEQMAAHEEMYKN